MALTRTTRRAPPRGRRSEPSQAARSARSLRPRRSDAPTHYRESSDDGDSDTADGSDVLQPSDDDATDDGSVSESGSMVLEVRLPRRPASKAATRRAPRRDAKSSRNATPGSSSKRSRKASRPTPSPSMGTPSRSRGAKRSRTPAGAAGTPSKRQKTAVTPDIPQPRGIIPNWRDPRIPYEAWADIFLYAAGQGTLESLNYNWLIRCATTCRAFEEPALSAVYRCPSIKDAATARRLATLLEIRPSALRLNYRAKIEALHIDIQVVPQSCLYRLIHPLSRLKELIVFTRWDQPPYRELNTKMPRHYTEDIFRALLPGTDDVVTADDKPLPTALESWEWSGRLIGGTQVPTIGEVSRIHQTPSFRHLTRLSLTNFQVPTLHRPEPKSGDVEAAQLAEAEDRSFIETIAEAISQLPSLKQLVFESSTVMDHRMLPLLPRTLTNLALINCWEVKSDDLAQFLRSHGNILRSLTLSHNQSLDLAFLTDLDETCPNLRELYMNLSYFRHHDSVDDSDPMYDQVLLPTQRPHWPQSIRVIDLEHIRDWSAETAEMFLQALIDDADRLPNLRHLAIKMMLNIPWQARATMRREWRDKMERVFLRPWDPPKALSTMQQLQHGDVPSTPQKKKRPDTQVTPPSRRSGRLAAVPKSSSRSKRSRHRNDRPMYQDPETDEDEFDYSDGEDEEQTSNGGESQPHGDEAAPAGRHELCNVVNIQFDNQKVRELQYSMEDFQDEESDDSEEEWNGDSEEDDTVFVWR